MISDNLFSASPEGVGFALVFDIWPIYNISFISLSGGVTQYIVGCAGKTGKEQWMRVPYGEELATHTGPESYVDSRKAIGEALTGGVRAGLLSRERYCKLQGADAVPKVEGNTGCIDTARCSWTQRGQRPRARTQAPCTGTGRSHVWPHNEVRAVNPNESQGSTTAMNERGKPDSPVVPGKLPNKGRSALQPVERVEGRGLAEGNLFQQPRFRTQSRSDLQNALRRIRQAAQRLRVITQGRSPVR
jgi:RNA-directed DNA polymerase